MKSYFRIENGKVVGIKDKPHPDCPLSTDEPVDLGWTYSNGVLDGTAKAQAAAVATAVSGIYAPVEYNGKLYPVDGNWMLKYEAAKQSRGRGKLNRTVAFATDGTPLKLSNAAAIDAFHAAMEDAITARNHALHDAI